MFRQLRRSSVLRKTAHFAPDRSQETIYFRETPVEVSRRAFKRSIGITLQVNRTIKVSAPKSAPLRKIQEFLDAHGEWISLHLQKYEELRRRYPQKRYCEGESFLYLGRQLALRFRQGRAARVAFRVEESALVCEIPPARWSGFKPHEPHPELASELIAFYEKSGRTLLNERVALHSSRMGLFPTALSFRSQKTRWGSCSSQGRVSLNWRLIVAPLDVVDYVVIHELAHLRYYNHSKSFWGLVASQRPDYRELRLWLKMHQYEADFLARKSELHV